MQKSLQLDVSHYKLTIDTFISKWGTLVSPKVIESLEKLWKWVRGYASVMSTSSSAAVILSYFKLGINLLEQFVAVTDHNQQEFLALSQKCRMQLIRNMSDDICNQKTANQLQAIVSGYPQFVANMIGCKDETSALILKRLEKLQAMMPPEYVSGIQRLANKCLQIRLDATRM